MTTTPTRSLDDLVRAYTDLQQRQADIVEELNNIKAEIRDQYDIGTYDTAGLKVTIREPNRVFDLSAAVDMLPEPLREQCRLDGYDARKVKQYLAPAVLELVMKPGSGNRIVSIS